LTAGLSYLTLNGANRVRHPLLVAPAVQFFDNGLTDLGLIGKFE
jgi:hypothetical protein